jgi:class 3 adenylate cyclase
MGVLRLKYEKVPAAVGPGNLFSVDSSDFDQFSPAVLGLGDLATRGEYVEALAAVFDLEGFTNFCNQSDPHLATPEFLSEFLKWLFDKISAEIRLDETKGKSTLWASLPFFSKFMGDGILFLWDTTYADSNREVGNVVLLLRRVCEDYASTFRPQIKNMVSRTPTRLRCGISRGRVISVGNGQDFVGPCINIASRLQKLGKLGFSFSRKGMNPDLCFAKTNAKRFITKQVSIRGIGEDELVVLVKEEFDALLPKEKKLFSNP